MNTINIVVGACIKSYGIPIGRRGENEVTAVQFDISTLVDSFGEGAVELLVQRPTDTAPYPVSVTTDRNAEHSSILFSSEGFPIMHQCYKHEGEAE